MSPLGRRLDAGAGEGARRFALRGGILLGSCVMGAAMALVAGLVWDGVGPAWVFIAYVAIDLAVRVPLLATMPDTLRIAHGATGATGATGA